MRIFLAGIMQGSHAGPELHCQQYRGQLRELLERHLPHCRVYDPLADHGNSLEYDDATGRRVFMEHNRLCREVDVVLAFVPQASMGTAIEMWEAHRHGRIVLAISPLAHNWAVKFLSHALYENLDQFVAELIDGRVASRLKELSGQVGLPGDV